MSVTTPVVAHLGDGSLLAVMELVGPAAVLVLAARTRGRRSQMLMGLAAIAMVVVVTPPLATWAVDSVTGHMVQHLVILLIAAPTLGIAVSTGRRRTGRVVRRLLSIGVVPAHAPLTAGLAHLAVMAAWHLPLAYDAALGSPILHGLEHVTMLVSGVWWWAASTHHARRRGVGTAMLSMFGVSAGGAVVGVAMMFAPDPLYGQGGVADQQLAGALMAGAMGACLTVAASTALARMLGRTADKVGTGRIALLAVVAATVAIAGGGPAAAAEDDAGAGKSGTGEELYRRDCVSCHGPNGEGSYRGPSLADTGEAGLHYYLHTGRMPIAHPDQPIRRRQPAYTDDQIDRLIEYTLRFTEGPDLPDLPEDGGDLAAGGTFFRLHCAACHGASGDGGALTIEGYAPPLHPATELEVAAAVITGPGAMPSFTAALEPEEIAGVANYVAALEDLPRSGVALPGDRVGEGMVGGVLVALLLVAARWIGRTG